METSNGPERDKSFAIKESDPDTTTIEAKSREDVVEIGKKILQNLDSSILPHQLARAFEDEGELRPGGVYAMWVQDRNWKGEGYRLYVQNRNAKGSKEFNGQRKRAIDEAINPQTSEESK